MNLATKDAKNNTISLGKNYSYIQFVIYKGQKYINTDYKGKGENIKILRL